MWETWRRNPGEDKMENASRANCLIYPNYVLLGLKLACYWVLVICTPDHSCRSKRMVYNLMEGAADVNLITLYIYIYIYIYSYIYTCMVSDLYIYV